MQKLINAIAVLSFFMTATSWIVSVYRNRVRVDFAVLDYVAFNHSNRIFCRITNISTLPIVIYSIDMVDGDVIADCLLRPVVIQTIHDEPSLWTADFPLNLAGTQGRSEYVEYQYSPKNKPISLSPEKMVAFRIHTSRGTVRKYVTLGQPGIYLPHKSPTSLCSTPRQ